MSEVFNSSVLDAINRAVQDGVSTTALEVDGTPQYCIINAETREIEIPGELNIFGVESDEKSTRVYFRCPKYVGTNVDLDMTQCMVYVPYRNANGEKDQYIVTDLNETEDGENVEFTWLISRKASAYMGITEFGIRAIKTAVGGTIEAEWNTTVASANVIRGMDVGLLEFSEENKDALTQALDLVKQEIELTKQNSIEEIEQKGQETLESIPEDYTQLQADVESLNQGGLILKEDFIGAQIDEWLNEHPEATTTVQDSSLTVNKFVKSMYSMIGYGADNKGVEDCSGVLNSIVENIRRDFLSSGNFDQPNVIVFESGKYVFENGVEIPPYCKIRVQGAVEIISKVTGALFTFARKDTDLPEIHYEKKAIYSSYFIDGGNGGLLIFNSNYPNNTDGSIAIQYGDGIDYGMSASESFTGIRNATIVGFNEGLRYTSHNIYCIKHERCHFSRCSKTVNYYTSDGESSNIGENFTYMDCIIEGSDIVSNHMLPNVDENYINCSIDYNTVVFNSEIDYPRSKIYINGGHIEGWGIEYDEIVINAKGIVSGKWGNSLIMLDGTCLVSIGNNIKPFSLPYYGAINIDKCSWDVINFDELDGENRENWFISDNVMMSSKLNGKIPFERPFSSSSLNWFISGNYTEAYMATSESFGLEEGAEIKPGYLIKYGLGGDNTILNALNLKFKKVSEFYWDEARTFACRKIDLSVSSTGESYLEIVTPFLEIDKIKYAIFDSPYINGNNLKAKVEYYNSKKEIIRTVDYYTNSEKQKNGEYMQSRHFKLENNTVNSHYCKIYFKYYFGIKNEGDEVSIGPVFVEKLI